MKTALILLCVLAIGFVSACTASKEPVACTEEAKICPDGSMVSRNGANNCEFDPCPDTKNPIACPEDAFQCPDGSYVSRDPENNCQFICPEK